MFRDDAQGSEVNVNVGDLDNTDFQLAITDFETGTEGLTYRVMVRAFNREGSVDSPYLLIVNAGLPHNISSPVDLLSRNETSLTVRMPIVSDDDSVLSYEIQIDDGFGNPFNSYSGLDYNLT